MSEIVWEWCLFRLLCYMIQPELQCALSLLVPLFLLVFDQCLLLCSSLFVSLLLISHLLLCLFFSPFSSPFSIFYDLSPLKNAWIYSCHLFKHSPVSRILSFFSPSLCLRYLFCSYLLLLKKKRFKLLLFLQITTNSFISWHLPMYHLPNLLFTFSSLGVCYYIYFYISFYGCFFLPH